ncbi:MAG: GNAT family N-acetyltransferase, partial [Eubacteriales bacterium]
VAAFDGDEPIGAVNFPEIYFNSGENTYRGGYIFAAWVKTEYRGRGIFSAMMENAERKMRERGFSFSFVVPENEELFPMYKKMGYDRAAENGFPYVASRDTLREYTPTDDIYVIWKVYSRAKDMFVKGMEFFEHTMRDAEENGKLFAVSKDGYIIYTPRFDGRINVYDRMEGGHLVDSKKRYTRALYKVFDKDMRPETPVFNMFFEPEYGILDI